MTLNTGYKPNVFQGNGVIKEFTYDFNPISIQYLKVYFEEEGVWVEQTSGWVATAEPITNYDLSVYSLNDIPEADTFTNYGGVVTFDEPPTTRVQIARLITEEQPTSFKTSSGFDAKVIETSLDKLTGMVQQLQEASDRSVKVTVGDNQTPEELLEEVYDKLDSATEVAEAAIEAANQAQIAADNATIAVESAENTLREVTAYVDSAKIEINDTKTTAIEEVDNKVTGAKAEINTTVINAQSEINFTKDTAISAVESAVSDLDSTVTQAKAEIVNTVEQGKSDIQGYIAESETEIRQIARDEAQEVIDAGKGEIEDYARVVIKPELDSLVTSASASAVLASQKASEANNSASVATSASNRAVSSATTAENWARYAENKGHPNWGYIGGNIESQSDLMSKFDNIDDKIKEIELFKFPNAVIIGEPTIQNGQVSDFSTVSYLQFPFILDLHEKAFQIDMCFTTATNVQTQQNILDSNFGLALAIQNGKGIMAISSNGTSWDIGNTTGSINIQSNTTYYARLIWNRLQYKTQISTDGINYVDDMVIVDTRRPYPRTMFIGGCDQLETGHTGHPFLGTINMNKCSLSVMGNVIWQGMDDAGLSTRADISLSNLDEEGKAKFDAKQDKLIAGEGIEIVDNVITATGGGGSTEVDFVQPLLTENGIFGGANFAVLADSEIDTSRQAWKAFDGNVRLLIAETDQWHSGNGQPHWIAWSNPTPMKVTQVTIYNGADNVLPLDWQFEYSDDSFDWVELTSGTNNNLTANGMWSFDVANSGWHRFYRFKTTSGYGFDNAYLGLTEIQITGKVVKPETPQLQHYKETSTTAEISVGADNVTQKMTMTSDMTTFTGNVDFSNATVTGIDAKANIDADNFTATGKSTLASYAMPSSKYIDLTLGASGATYTAPANGWYVLNKTSTGSNQRLAMLSGGCIVSVFSSASSQPLALMIPCTKGTKIEARYTVAGTTNEFRFYYAEGDK